MASLRSATGQDKAKALRKRIDDSLDTLAKAVDDVRASEAFKTWKRLPKNEPEVHRKLSHLVVKNSVVDRVVQSPL